MGFFKKLFRPVAKVFDKIIPNEIKPALPYLAAFAPMLAPTTGFMGSMMGRALLSGGANIGAQLAQEGNEGDINELSALLAGGIGALSTPGSTGGRTMGSGSNASYSQVMGGDKLASVGNQSAGNYLRDLSNSGGIGDKALNFLGQGADKLSAINIEGGANPFSKAGLKAAALPFAQGTGDLMYAEGTRALKDYEIALRDYELSLENANLATDFGRRNAIIQAMTGNHTQEVIDETLAELGLRDGGRIGYAGGGGITDIFAETSFKEPDFGGITEAVTNIGEENDLVASRQQDLFMLREEAIMKRDQDKILEIESDFLREFNMEMPMSEGTTEESVTQMAAEGGIMNGYNMGGSVLPQGMEMDYRQGGMIPMGSEERADDVPARVSKNEFVMTADAVRAAGGGSVNKGAKRMYEMMNNLEARA